jgi:hypothetical protein
MCSLCKRFPVAYCCKVVIKPFTKLFGRHGCSGTDRPIGATTGQWILIALKRTCVCCASSAKLISTSPLPPVGCALPNADGCARPAACGAPEDTAVVPGVCEGAGTRRSGSRHEMTMSGLPRSSSSWNSCSLPALYMTQCLAISGRHIAMQPRSQPLVPVKRQTCWPTRHAGSAAGGTALMPCCCQEPCIIQASLRGSGNGSSFARTQCAQRVHRSLLV